MVAVKNEVCERKRRPTESRAERTSSPMICRAGAASEDVHSAMWSSIIARWSVRAFPRGNSGRASDGMYRRRIDEYFVNKPALTV